MKLPKLPNQPGCYLFKNRDDKIVYIGKAKNIKKRVMSYFSGKQSAKTQLMLEHAKKLDFIVTDNEVEALILENTLIKKHRPDFNINLKDAKGYAYLKVTDEKFPRLLVSRDKKGDGKFIGPFVSASRRDRTKKAMERIFRLRTCSHLPKKACLRKDINLCDGPCVGGISEKEYGDNVEKVVEILSGNLDGVIEKIQLEMDEASKKKRFEWAIRLRDQISALKSLKERQKMERERRYEEEIINFILRGEKAYLMIFKIKKGTLVERRSFVFDWTDDFLEEFLVRHYSENRPPKTVILPQKTESSMEKFLSDRRKGKVKIVVPKKGDRKSLLDLVKKNIELTYFKNQDSLEILQKNLSLETLPLEIEGIDISHISGEGMVGSVVRFSSGEPDKKNYRRFKIKERPADDTKAMAEVVKRRYSRLKEEGGLPDMILLDGGKGQLSTALSELKKLNLDIETVALAKKEESIYIPNISAPLKFPKKDRGLQLLQRVRDEAHRFAKSYNLVLRKKMMLNG